jgi:hypothetical protein
MIKKFALDLKEGKIEHGDMIRRICDICKNIKAEETVCQLHQEKDNVPTSCNACIGYKSGEPDYCI